MSLHPILESVKKDRPRSELFSFGFDRDHTNKSFQPIVDAEMPIIVASSPGSAVRWLEVLRPRWSYHFIGVEHGLSPFKKFTYSDAFLCYDDYFAPSRLWKDRLEKLYPNRRTRFHLGGYPKAIQFSAAHAKENNNTLDVVERKSVVVVFSWGVKEEELYKFPDIDDIIFILHPSQEEFEQSKFFKKAKIVKSTFEKTKDIINSASCVYGDISSLTFEVSRLITTYYVLDRRLYIDDYDVDDMYMKKTSKDYGRIPETNLWISKEFILDKEDLAEALLGKTPKKKKPVGLCPIINYINGEGTEDQCSEGIVRIANFYDSINLREKKMSRDSSIVEFIRNAYLTILNREPDLVGMQHYVSKIRNSDESLLLSGLEILNDLAHSDEARQRLDIPNNAWPILRICTDFLEKRD